MISVAQWWFLLEFARDLFSDLSSLLSSTQRNFQDVLADKKDKILDILVFLSRLGLKFQTEDSHAGHLQTCPP